MRKIVSKKEEQKKQRRNQLIVGGILIFVMLFSTIGYAFRGSPPTETKKVEYGGLEFVYENNYWVLELEGIKFYFSSNPSELELIESNVNSLDKYAAKPLYLSSYNQAATSQIYLNIGQVAERVQLACLEEENCAEDLPIKDCESNFIIVEESDVSEIVQDNNCVYIRGEKQNLNKLVDVFVLKTLGI